MEMKLTVMLRETKSTLGKEISIMAPCKKTEFSTSRFHKLVPMVIERYKKNHASGLQKNFKFVASSDMTISQLVSILRHKMKVGPNQSYHLMYSKGRTAVMMSQRLGDISSEYRDPVGVLCFIFAAQSTFGCPVPCVKPIKSKFPGMEPNPFGAPEPSLWMEDTIMAALEEEEQYMIPMPDMTLFMEYILNVIPNHDDSDSEPEDHVVYTYPPILTPEVNLSLNPVPQVTHNYTQTEPESASNSNSQSTSYSEPQGAVTPMEASGSTPEPLTLLIQELDHFVPFWHIQFMPIPAVASSTSGSMDSTTLVTALNRLVQALQNHPPTNVGTPVTVSPPTTQPNLYLMDQFYSPFEAFGGHLGSTTLTSSQASNALTLANQVLAALQGESDVPPLPEAASGTTQFTMLGQYFNQVAQNLEFQHLVSHNHTSPILTPLPLMLDVTNDNVNDDHVTIWSSPHQMALPPSSSYSVLNGPTLYLTDSDSLSEDEVDLEYFCDILL